MRRSHFIFITLLLFSSALVHGGTHPSFSGTWEQNMEKSPTHSTWLKSYTNTIDQQETALKVTTTMVSDRGERTFDRTFEIGKENKSQDSEGDEITTTVKWNGNALVFESVEKEHDGTLSNQQTETWTLSDNGKTLTKTIHRSASSHGTTDQKYVLEKQ